MRDVLFSDPARGKVREIVTAHHPTKVTFLQPHTGSFVVNCISTGAGGEEDLFMTYIFEWRHPGASQGMFFHTSVFGPGLRLFCFPAVPLTPVLSPSPPLSHIPGASPSSPFLDQSSPGFDNYFRKTEQMQSFRAKEEIMAKTSVESTIEAMRGMVGDGTKVNGGIAGRNGAGGLV